MTASFSICNVSKSVFVWIWILFCFILCVKLTAISLSHFCKMRSPRIETVTSDPNAQKIEANSTAIGPPPNICSFLGILSSSSSSSLDIALDIKGFTGTAPAAIKIFFASNSAPLQKILFFSFIYGFICMLRN